MEYSKALKLTELVLKTSERGPEELVAAYRIQGLCLSAMGKLDDAVMDFRRLLAIDPSFRLSTNVSPKLAAPFYQAVAMTQDQSRIRINHVAPQPQESLAGLELTVDLESDPLRMVGNIRLRYWTVAGGSKHRIVTPVVGLGKVSIALPQKLRALQVYYCLDATNSAGSVLVRVGSIEDPFQIALKARDKVAAPAEPPEKKAPEPEKTASMIMEAQTNTLVHEPPKDVKTFGGLELTATLKAGPLDKKVELIRLKYWTDRSTDEQELFANLEGPGQVIFKLPDDLRAKELKYYLEGTELDGNVLVSAGDDSKPFHLAVDPLGKLTDADWGREQGRGSTRWYTSWWFWTVAGVFVVGSTFAGLGAGGVFDGGAGDVDYRVGIGVIE